MGVEEQLHRDVHAPAARALGCTLHTVGVILFLRRVSPIISRPRTTVARDLCQRHRTGSVSSPLDLDVELNHRELRNQELSSRFRGAAKQERSFDRTF